jgi:hypothetical protein
MDDGMSLTSPALSGTVFVDMLMPDEALERTYGILWREPSPSQFAADARAMLLSVLNTTAQKRGIAYALQRYGEVTIPEILSLP